MDTFEKSQTENEIAFANELTSPAPGRSGRRSHPVTVVAASLLFLSAATLTACGSDKGGGAGGAGGKGVAGATGHGGANAGTGGAAGSGAGGRAAAGGAGGTSAEGGAGGGAGISGAGGGAGDSGAGGDDGAGGAGGAAGAAGAGGTAGAAGVGGRGTAGMGGRGGNGGRGGSAGAGGAAGGGGRGGAGGAGGVAGAGGRGGTAGAGGAGGAGGSTAPAFSRTFDTTTESAVLSDFADPNATNLGAAGSGSTPTLTFDGTLGNPAAGSLKAAAHFTDYLQYIDVNLNLTPAVNLMGKTLHAKVRLASGAFAGQVTLHADTTNAAVYGAGTPVALTQGAWTDLTLNLASVTTTGWNASQVVQIGLLIETGDRPATGTFGAAVDAVINIDSIIAN